MIGYDAWRMRAPEIGEERDELRACPFGEPDEEFEVEVVYSSDGELWECPRCGLEHGDG